MGKQYYQKTLLTLLMVIAIYGQSLGQFELLKDIEPGFVPDESSNPRNFTEANGLLFFAATSAEHGRELWVTDGTEQGTRLVKDLNTNGSSYPKLLTAVGNELYFVADLDSEKIGLWKTDGLEENTVLIKDFPRSNYFVFRSITSFNGLAIFLTREGTDSKLWRTDGTEGGTEIIANTFFRASVVYNNELYFLSYQSEGAELWKTDGTVSGTSRVKQITIENSFGMILINMIHFDGHIYFSMASHNASIWKSDGTDEGTVLIYQGGGTIHEFIVLDNTLIARANNDLINIDADANEYNTVYNSGYISSFLVRFGNYIYFNNGGNNDYGIWRTDGTIEGTSKITDIVGSSFIVYKDFLYFRSFDIDNGNQLWRTDGTSEGTELFKMINAAKNNFGSFTDPIVFNDNLYFNGNDYGFFGAELWKSNGTPEGTQLLKDINAQGGADITNVVVLNDQLIFGADDGFRGNHLWSSDGTEAGTDMLVKIDDLLESKPQHLTKVNNVGYFTTYHSAFGRELWKTDGTAAGTQLVRDITPGVTSTTINHLFETEDVLFFTVGARGDTELWTSDGTEAGTYSLTPNQEFYDIANVIKVGEVYYFQTMEFYGADLWKTDGTPEGTVIVVDINENGTLKTGLHDVKRHLININGTIYFNSYRIEDNYHIILKSDGTEVGTTILTGEVSNSQLFLQTHALLEFNNELLIVTKDGLFITNGSESEYVSFEQGSFSSKDRVLVWDEDVYYLYPNNGRLTLYKKNGQPNGRQEIVSNVFDYINITGSHFDAVLFQHNESLLILLQDISNNVATLFNTNMKVLCSLAYSGNLNLRNVATLNDKLFFTSTGGSFGSGELYYYDTTNEIPCKFSQIITFDLPEEKNDGEATFQLVAESSANLPVSFKSSNQQIANIEGDMITVLSIGDTEVTAFQEGNEEYFPAEVTRSLRVNVVTSVNEKININNLNLYPNPVKEQFMISWNAASEYEVSITDLSGQTVLPPQQILATQAINIHHLKAGVYLVKIRAGSENAWLKIIKR